MKRVCAALLFAAVFASPALAGEEEGTIVVPESEHAAGASSKVEELSGSLITSGRDDAVAVFVDKKGKRYFVAPSKKAAQLVKDAMNKKVTLLARLNTKRKITWLVVENYKLEQDVIGVDKPKKGTWVLEYTY